MVLDDVCNSRLYADNPFYVLGVAVDSSVRQLRRKQEDVIDGFMHMGDAVWHREMGKHLLGDDEPIDTEVAKALFERLKNPEYFVTQMFFWIWPYSEGKDQAVELLLKGNRDTAVRIWREDINKPGSRGAVARHNLAVILHFYAIEGERRVYSSDVSLGTCYRKMVDQYWKASFDLWEELFDDEIFWHVFAKKIAKLDDPRLGKDFVDSFRIHFPICFDNINADFFQLYARAGNLKDAKRHFEYMTVTMSGLDDVEESMERAFRPMVESIRALIGRCERPEKPKDILPACRNLLDKSKNLVSVFKAVIPAGNSYTKTILNEIVLVVDKSLPSYSRETGDYTSCLQMTRELLPIAATALQIERIKRSINEWEDLIRKERELRVCCVCGRYEKDIGKKTVQMYRDVGHDPNAFGRVQWSVRTISNVPVCSVCLEKFKETQAVNFSPVAKSLREGWKLGGRPPQSEIDAVNWW